MIHEEASGPGALTIHLRGSGSGWFVPGSDRPQNCEAVRRLTLPPPRTGSSVYFLT